jgi:hypothetical protein
MCDLITKILTHKPLESTPPMHHFAFKYKRNYVLATDLDVAALAAQLASR